MGTDMVTGPSMTNKRLWAALLALGCSHARADVLGPNQNYAASAQGTPSGAATSPGPTSASAAPASGTQPSGRSLVITPKVSLSETYTDNLTLSSINPISDFITQVTPGINIRENSRRTKLKLNYDLLALYYNKESALDHYYSQLDASGNVELIDNLFYLNAAASNIQQPFALNGAYGLNLSNPSGNIVNLRNTNVSPYLTHRFGSFATGLAEFSHVTQSYSMGGPSTSGYGYLGPLSSSTSDTSTLTLNSGTSFYTIPWGINLSDSNIHYTGVPDTRIANYSANIGYLFTRKFKITLTGGYDDNNYVYFGQKPQQAFWSIGAGYAPTTRTQLSVSTGRRYFGSTKSFMLKSTNKFATLQASYDQNITSSIMQDYISPATTLDQLLQTQIPNDTARQQAVQAILSSMGSQLASLYGQNVIANQIYLDKTFKTTLGVTLLKNTFIFTMFDSKMSSLQPGNSFLPGVLGYGAANQIGGTATWNWKLTPKLSWNANANLVSSTFPGQTFSQRFGEVYMGFSRQLGLYVNGSIMYRYQTMTYGTLFNYNENALIAGLNFTY